MFKKWVKIINANKLDDYQEDFKHLLIGDIKFEVTEKIHGTNFSIYIDEHGNVQYARRKALLKEDEKFFNYQRLFQNHIYTEMIEHFSAKAVTLNKTIQIYGELYGGNIQKEIYYGNEINFKWFGVRVGGELLTPAFADDFMDGWHGQKVPVLYKKHFLAGTQDFIDFIHNFDYVMPSYLTPFDYNKPNLMEGIVIRPYYENITIPRTKEMLIVKIRRENIKKR